MPTKTKSEKASAAPEVRATQPGTADIDAALAQEKEQTRKIYATIQAIIEARDHE